MVKPSSRLIKIFLAEVIAIGAIVAYFLIDSHDIYRWWVGDTHFVQAPKTCNLHTQSCSVILDTNQTLILDIAPKPIPLMKPLVFRLYAPSSGLLSVELKLFATNMNMGLHTFTLHATQDGWYEGEGMLPTCVVGNMIWQANVILNTPTQSLGAVFYFQTDK